MDFASIHNYYEHLVEHYLKKEVIPKHDDQPNDFFMDIACYALTKLPTRYVRHDIDMAFFTDGEERDRMETEVKVAVDDAVKYIEENFNKGNRYDD